MSSYQMDLAFSEEEFQQKLDLLDNEQRHVRSKKTRIAVIIRNVILVILNLVDIWIFLRQIHIGNMEPIVLLLICLMMIIIVLVFFNMYIMHQEDIVGSVLKNLGMYMLLSSLNEKKVSHVWVDQETHICTLAFENTGETMPTVVRLHADPIQTEEAPGIADNAIIADINTEKYCMSLKVLACYPEPDMYEWLHDHHITPRLMYMQKRYLWKSAMKFLQ